MNTDLEKAAHSDGFSDRLGGHPMATNTVAAKHYQAGYIAATNMLAEFHKSKQTEPEEAWVKGEINGDIFSRRTATYGLRRYD